MRRIIGVADRAVEFPELRRQGIAALVNAQMHLFSIDRVIARTSALADMAGQADDGLAANEHLIGTVGPDVAPGAVLEAKPLDLKFPAMAFDLDRDRGILLNVRCLTSAARPTAA